MNNISHIRDCYGCGVCAIACPKKIIKIGLNKDGFYTPEIINIDACINCGICIDVCAFSHEDIAQKSIDIKSYAAWSNDTKVRDKCSSGGIGFEIGKQLINEGYKVCGVKYNTSTKRAEHYISATPEELVQTIGSKYIQSYTVDGFNAINKKEKNLVIGTPCQIDSFRRYIKRYKIEDNFILMDFFCHCVPSLFAWNKYCLIAEKRIGKITYATWRNKFTGWHDSWAMSLDNKQEQENLLSAEKGVLYSLYSQGDLFYKLFLGDFCANKACHKNCKYKNLSSSADIRIGDLWGNFYKDDEKGVSALISFTEKGDLIIKRLKNSTIIEHSVEITTEGQMKGNINHAVIRPIIMALLRSRFYIPKWTFKLAFLSNSVLRRLKIK